jgi:hypothetical protein
MPTLTDPSLQSETLLPEGKVAVEIRFSPQTILTAEELASLIDGVQAYHDLLGDAAGVTPGPVWIETIKHPNSLILIASAFLVAHKATFIAGATWIGTLAAPYLQLRKSTREWQKLRLEAERDKAKSAPLAPLPPSPPDGLKEAIEEALAVVSQLDSLSSEQRARVFHATLLAKLSPAEREQIQAALKGFGIDQIVARTEPPETATADAQQLPEPLPPEPERQRSRTPKPGGRL